MNQRAGAISIPLAGRFSVLEGREADIDTARRVEYPDGRVAFTVEFRDPEEDWDLRIESRDGRRFEGRLTSPDWEAAQPVKMEAWRSADGDREWLLRGSWLDPDEGEVAWEIVLFADDE